ncbi:TPA: DUF4888 domain-containing protein, partial [Staphylococcus aureus]|nr:DUF4888 domain-containing protein [Staphylococcus aureus]
TKLLGKTLVASALVLTTLGTGLHSSYLGLDTNKVVKTAKADSLSDGQLWLGVKNPLIDAQIISGNKDEEIKVTYLRNDGVSNVVSAYGNNDGGNFTESIDFKSLKQIDLTKENVQDDFNKELDAKNTWNSLTEKLKSHGLVKNGQKLSIHSSNNPTPVSGTVGEEVSTGGENKLTKRLINKITID